MNIFTGLFASIPYTSAKNQSGQNDPFENYFQAIIYIVFTLLDQFVTCEMHTAVGRIDCVVKTKDFIYVFEFKRDGNVYGAPLMAL